MLKLQTGGPLCGAGLQGSLHVGRHVDDTFGCGRQTRGGVTEGICTVSSPIAVRTISYHFFQHHFIITKSLKSSLLEDLVTSVAF